jgi:hypothetical protein
MIGDVRLFPSNMRPHSFSTGKLAVITLILDEEEKNADLSDNKKRVCGFTSSKLRTTWSPIVNDFRDLWNFCNCIDAIDKKHVKILASPNSVSKFLNCKHSFSVVLLALVDGRYKFTVVDTGSYGRNSDGGIFAHSKLGEYLEIHLDIPEDNSFPEHHDYLLMLLLTHLLT